MSCCCYNFRLLYYLYHTIPSFIHSFHYTVDQMVYPIDSVSAMWMFIQGEEQNIKRNLILDERKVNKHAFSTVNKWTISISSNDFSLVSLFVCRFSLLHFCRWQILLMFPRWRMFGRSSKYKKSCRAGNAVFCINHSNGRLFNHRF